MARAANLFSAESDLLTALRPLAADMPADRPLHIGSAIDVVGTREISGLLPGIFVAPAPPASYDAGGGGISEVQVYDVTCAVRSISGRPDAPATHEALGELAGSAMLAVLAATDMEYAGRLDIEYRVGHAEVTLQFACERMLDPALDPSLADFIRFRGQWDVGPEPDQQPEARDAINVPGASAPVVAEAMQDLVRSDDWPRATPNEDDET